MTSKQLQQMNVFLFDLDGCIYHGDILSPCSQEFIKQLRDENKKVCFVTNNSRQISEEICTKLIRMGLNVYPNEIYTATDYTGKHIADKYGALNVKVAGTESLEKSMEFHGHNVYPFHSESIPDVIVISRDIEFTYVKLQKIAEDAGKGARVISANPDMYHPGKHGIRVPETGALVSSIEAVIDEKIEFVGKPAPYLFRSVTEYHEVSPDECVMVGDNLQTDIEGGMKAGMRTVWIRGDQKASALKNTRLVPNYIVQNIEELYHLYNRD